MISVDLFEKILKASLQNDRHGVSQYLDEAMEIAENKKNRKDLEVLKNLSISVHSVRKKGMGAQTASPFLLTKQSLLYERLTPGITLDEVILPTSKRSVVKDLLNEWESKDNLIAHGLMPNNRLVVYGPPGTGKTKLAQAISNYLNIEMIYVRLDELISSYLGKTGKNIREIFDIADKEPVIIFLDEIDTIAKHRDDGQDLGELKRVVTVLLQNIDMLSPHSILIAATNHPHMLDNAIWRRFPYRLELEQPQREERRKLLKLFLGSHSNSIDFDELAQLTDGLSGSDIKELSEKTLRKALMINKSLENDLAFSIFIQGIYSQKNDRKTRKRIYTILQDIYHNGKYSLQQLSDMSGIPYTTLRDNLKDAKK